MLLKRWLGWEERFGLARCVHELHEELARQRDGIPDDVLAQCKCIMSVRVFKTGIGVLSQGIGYGCLVMRVLPDLGDGQDANDQDDDHKAESVVNGSSSHPKSKWSPPVAIKLIGISAGVALGFRKSHLLIISNTDVVGRDLMTGAKFSLGADLSIVRGPQRGDLTPRQALELNFKPVAFTYDRSGGAYLGIGLQGSVIVNRPEENRIYYEDQNVSPENVLRGQIRPPPGARALELLLASLPEAASAESHQPPPFRVEILHHRHKRQTHLHERKTHRSRQLPRDNDHALRRAPSTLISYLRDNTFWRFFALLIIALMVLRALPSLLLSIASALLSRATS